MEARAAQFEDADYDMIEKLEFRPLAFRRSGEPCHLPESLNKRADGTCWEPIFRTHFWLDKRLAN